MAVIADIVRIVPAVTRNTETVPFKEFEQLFLNLKNKIGGPKSEFLQAIGYTGATIYSDWQKKGQVPRRAFYALKGFAAELLQREKPEPTIVEKIVPVYKDKQCPLTKDDIATLIVATARCQELEFIPAVALIKKLQELE